MKINPFKLLLSLSVTLKIPNIIRARAHGLVSSLLQHPTFEKLYTYILSSALLPFLERFIMDLGLANDLSAQYNSDTRASS